MNDQANKLRQLNEMMSTSHSAILKPIKSQARVITVTSGKGGVGKTNFTVALAVSFARMGKKVLVIDAETVPSRKCLSAVLPQGAFYLEVEGLLDVAAEIERLGQEMAKLESEIERSRGKLGNARFVENAPAEVVENERERLKETEARLSRIRENMRSLGQGE